VLDLTGSPNLSGLGRYQKLIGQNGQNNAVFDKLGLGRCQKLKINQLKGWDA
jgi:hypothetical protein